MKSLQQHHMPSVAICSRPTIAPALLLRRCQRPARSVCARATTAQQQQQAPACRAAEPLCTTQQQHHHHDLQHTQQQRDAGRSSTAAAGAAVTIVALAAVGLGAQPAAAAAAADVAAVAAAGGLQLHSEPANALSLPTWAIHVSSVTEWVAAMGLAWRYAEVSGQPAWKGLTWGMVPALGSAMAACTWHFFYNSPDLDFLVALQAFLTVVGNCTCWAAAYRIFTAARAQQPSA